MRYAPGFGRKVLQHKVFWLVFILVLTVHLYNVGAQRLYPFLDTPNHLALAGIYKSYGEPGNQLETFFSLKMFPRPNVFHTVFCGSHLFPDIEVANKVFYLLYTVLFVSAVLLLIVRCRGNLWYGLLAFLFLYNINVCYGFTGFTIALPAVLLLLYCIINYIEKRSFPAAMMIAAVLPGIFFMHAMVFLFAVVVYVMCVFFDMYRLGTWRRLFVHLGICIPGVVLFLIWYISDSREYSGPSIVQSLLHYYRHSFLSSFWQRGAFMIHDNFRLSGTLVGYVIAAAFSLVALFYAVLPTLKRQVHKEAIPSVGFYCICIFLACSIACTLFMPEVLPGYSFLYQRFSVLVFLGVIVVGSIVAPKDLSVFLKTGLCAIVVLHALVWFQCFRAFDIENEGFDKTFFSACTTGDVVGGLIYDYRFRNVSVYDNCPDYYAAWTNGVSTTRLADDRSFVIRRRVGTDVLPEYIYWLGKGGSRQYDGRYANLDYLLVRGDIPAQAQEMLQHFTVVNQRGAWLLYANRERIRAVRPYRQ
jgi:hypothetical protein